MSKAFSDSLASPDDSRGPGWYCGKCNSFNALKKEVCRNCKKERGKLVEP